MPRKSPKKIRLNAKKAAERKVAKKHGTKAAKKAR